MYYTNNYSKRTISHLSIPYTQSEINAIIAGYSEVADIRAYNGRYFIKNGKKWIHNIEALRKKLNDMYGYYICDEELSATSPEGFGYDVEVYYLHNAKNLISEQENFRQLMTKINIH